MTKADLVRVISAETGIIRKDVALAVDAFLDSVKDSIRMLYEDAPPNSIKRSMLYVYGANKIPVGVINSISNILGGIFDQNNSQVDMSTSNNTNVVLLSAVEGETRFEKYDPLGMISKDKTLDWDEPETSFNCELDLTQIE